MSDQQHPIIPSPELIKNWHDEWDESDQIVHSAYTHIAIRAAQWGADHELEACCEWLEREPDPGHVDLLRSCATALRAARRPKPLSLAEVALEEVQMACRSQDISMVNFDTIRLALERLQKLEGGNV